MDKDSILLEVMDSNAIYYMGLLLPIVSAIVIICAATLQYFNVTIFGVSDLFSRAGDLLVITSLAISYRKHKSSVGGLPQFNVENLLKRLNGILVGLNHKQRMETGKPLLQADVRRTVMAEINVRLESMNKRIVLYIQNNLYTFEYRTAMSGVVISITSGMNVPTITSFLFVILLVLIQIQTYWSAGKNLPEE